MNEKTAVVVLACSDFESFEISMAAHTKFMPHDAKIFVLQNGRGSYDCERTYKVAKRYADLFPRNIVVVDWIRPQAPYHAIKELLDSDAMREFDYICKIDDDCFPLTHGWLDALWRCHERSREKFGDALAYVTGLVNNNNFGFSKLIENSDLSVEYYSAVAREHLVGLPGYENYPSRIVPKNEIVDSGFGTIWRNAHVARWLHKKTTLFPDSYIAAVKKLPDVEIDSSNRYSINCMLFKKNRWNDIFINSSDDEYSWHMYCREGRKKIIAALNVPFVHLFYDLQRDENRDLLPVIRDCYQQWLELPFPISLCPVKEYEIENRMRLLEKSLEELKRDMRVVHSPRRCMKNWMKYHFYTILSRITSGETKKRFQGKRKKYEASRG